MGSNFNFTSIKYAIKQKVLESKEDHNNNVMSLHLMAKSEDKKEETEDEKKRRIGVPTYNVE